MPKFVQNVLRNMFGLDYRSLALLRIGLASLNLLNVWISVRSLRAFYTDDGVLPRSFWLADPVYPLTTSLHYAGGGAAFAAWLFLLQTVVALAMLVGYRTRVATVLSYVLLFSQQARNPLVLIGADQVLRLFSFWAIFLPLGRRYSLDVALGRTATPDKPAYLGWAGAAYIVQILLVYMMSAILKTGATWTVDHTAVYYALSLELYGRPFGLWLSQFDGLTRWLTIVTLKVELFVPLLFILPFLSKWARFGAFLVLAGLQVGFNATMDLGFFGPVMIAMTFALLPAEFWTWCAEPAGRWIRRRAGMDYWWSSWLDRTQASQLDRQTQVLHVTTPIEKGLRKTCGWMRDGILILLIAVILTWNYDTVPGHKVISPDLFSTIGWDTGLDQTFDLFAPDPMEDDGWFVVQGTLRNGKTVNVFTGESTVTFAKPASVADTYVDQRWRRYLIYISEPEYGRLIGPFAEYLGHRWNDAHPPAEQLLHFEIYFMHEAVLANHAPRIIEPMLLWVHTYDDEPHAAEPAPAPSADLPPPAPAAPAKTTDA